MSAALLLPAGVALLGMALAVLADDLAVDAAGDVDFMSAAITRGVGVGVMLGAALLFALRLAVPHPCL